jgi:hypothetical protein
MRRKPLQYVISSLVAVAAIVSFASWQQIVADGTANTDKQVANDDKLTDTGQLVDEVEVSVSERLRVAGKHTYSVTVTLTAKKEKTVAGPIFLVVQGTGIDTLQAKEPDGMTGEEEPYFLILPEIKKLR